MSINLSDLTSPNNQDIFAEITSGADFLDPIGKLKNLSRGANKGGHALQTVGLNQPRALPLIKNPSGNLGGYLYIPNVSGNYATGPSVTIGANQTWQAEVDMVITQLGNYVRPLGGGDWSSGFGLLISATQLFIFCKSGSGVNGSILGITLGTPFNLKYGFDGTYLYVQVDGTRANVTQPSNQATSITHLLELNQQTLNETGNYAIQKAKLTVNNAVVFDCDFNGSTSIRHGDTKFKCATGQVVTVNQSGEDPASIIKRPVLRFAHSASTSLLGTFASAVSGFHIFAALKILGGGGGNNAVLFGTNLTGGNTGSNDAFVMRKSSTSNELSIRYDGQNLITHPNFYDDARGDFLFDGNFKSGTLVSRVNNADTKTATRNDDLEVTEFSIANEVTSGIPSPSSFDLEYLALFPATITDAQADSVREHIRAKTQVYDLPTPIQNDYSVAFDGTDDYMSMTLPVLGNTHTLSAWFKTTASYGGAGSEGTLISYISSGGGNDDSVLSVMTNKVGWSDFTDDNQFGTSIVNDGNWHHAVAVVTASTQKIYVDGVLETTTSNAYSAGTSFSSATIGRRANAAQRFFNGNIDEVAIWDSALTANEVKSIYNDGKPVDLSGQPELYSSANNLVAWWRMGDNDSGTGTAVTDNSANSYNGSLVNGPTFQTNTP